MNKILITGGTGLVGYALQSIQQKCPKYMILYVKMYRQMYLLKIETMDILPYKT